MAACGYVRVVVTKMFADAMDLFFSDSSSSEDYDEYCGQMERNRVVKINGFWEKIVPLQSGDQFKSHFRMTRQTTQLVLEGIGSRIDNSGT